ncbi:apoptosis regulator BAX isoform X2 [Octopus bimaculoides]|uniref:apoptosis regulator BAX isoform X2 n=1 Tax=Octopus bimaculoides TaxID=37653 RepID=UPI0022E4F971|nr:apoptosis regulator BAX isoform X2 [Octopus bimaculoides]
MRNLPYVTPFCSGCPSACYYMEKTEPPRKNLNRDDVGNQARCLLNQFIHDRMENEGFENPLQESNLIEPDTPTGPPMSQLEEIGRALRCIGDELDGDQRLQDLVSRIEPEDIPNTFLNVASAIVSVNLTWDIVVRFFYFAYKMAIKALDRIPLIRAIINLVINFIVDNLADWILSRGGWEAIVEYFGTPKRQAFGVLIAGVLISVGVYAWKSIGN